MRVLSSPPNRLDPSSIAATAIADSTRKAYLGYLARLLRFARDPSHPNNRSPDETISFFLAHLAAEGKSPSTLANYMSAIRFAARVLGLPASTDSDLHKYLVRAAPTALTRRQWLHPSSLASLLARRHTRTRDKLLQVAISYFHGLRIIEALRLRPTDIDLPRSTIRVFPAKKADNRPVVAPLHPQAVPWAVIVCDLRATSPLSPIASETPQDLNKWFTDQLIRTRNAGATWHSLRRGMATFFDHAGAPIEVIRAQGRWVSDATVRKYICEWQE